MRPDEVLALLERVRSGDTAPEEALQALGAVEVADLGFAQLDIHREARQGLPEAIYAASKTPEQAVEIAAKLLDKTSGAVIATKVPPDAARALVNAFPSAEHEETSRLVILRRKQEKLPGRVSVVCAGTSDLPVATEAAMSAEAVGLDVELIADVGVAGVHRILAAKHRLQSSDVVIVVAGMEGALASVVGGLVRAPVVAVPTSVGYGTAFEGLAALLAMLNSCAAGVAVMNIDNGFGAAMFALRTINGRK